MLWDLFDFPSNAGEDEVRLPEIDKRRSAFWKDAGVASFQGPFNP
jgi:hypothetical protein